jgi:hypothetical protein
MVLDEQFGSVETMELTTGTVSLATDGLAARIA